jgi:hypothetical protein
MDLAFSRRLFLLAIFLIVYLCSSQAFPQNQPESVPKASNIVEYLMETISWYRGMTVEQQIADEPGDVTFLDENRRISGEIVRLPFDFARLMARNKSMEPKGNQTQEPTSVPSQNQRLIQAAAKADKQVEQSQNELQALRQKMATTPKRGRAALGSLIEETQS